MHPVTQGTRLHPLAGTTRIVFMRTFLATIAAIAALTLIAGCGGKSVVGKWDLAMSSTEPQADKMLKQMGSIKNAMEFKDDNTFVMEIMGNKMDGTYKMEDNKVTLTATGANAAGIADALTMSDDGNTLTGKQDPVTMTFTRAKAE